MDIIKLILTVLLVIVSIAVGIIRLTSIFYTFEDDFSEKLDSIQQPLYIAAFTLVILMLLIG